MINLPIIWSFQRRSGYRFPVFLLELHPFDSIKQILECNNMIINFGFLKISQARTIAGLICEKV
jgi:hypothetical protein